jgi:protein gp37
LHEAADPWRAEAWDIIDSRRDLTFIIPTHRIERAAPLLPWAGGEPWPHVWLLVSASTQREAGRAIIELFRIAAAVRGVSLEPLLEPVNLCGLTDGYVHYNALEPGLAVPQILDWVIVAGESGGPPDRALVQKRHPVWGWSPKSEATAWLRQIRDQCLDHGVPFHSKGWGGPRPDSGGRLLDGREWLEFPAK